MSPTTIPSPDQLVDRKVPETPGPAPSLPQSWQARVLLTPYGDANSALDNYRQLVIAEIECDVRYPAMTVDLYLTQDLKVYRLLFLGDGSGRTVWYWIEGQPGGSITNILGPFATSLQIPSADFLAEAQYGGNWAITGTSCDHWVLPAPPDGQIPPHGSWYSFREDGRLFRIFTFDSKNTVKLPILGSYYFAHIPTFASLDGPPDHLAATVEAVRRATPESAAPGFANDLLTQNQIQSLMANPLSPPATCTPADLQALIPGFVAAPSGVTLPVWADQTAIFGMTIGTDFIPYFTLVFYWHSYGEQQSIFIGLGPEAGKGTYRDRQDCVLNRSYTDVPQYYLENGAWVPSCCTKIPGIALPRPDWVEAAMQAYGGGVAGQITGNADFGLQPGEVLNLIDCELPRGENVTSLFWVWFTAEQVGVLFSESNFAESVTAHNLQLIDYVTFERNATWINAQTFSDPCASVPVCPQDSEAERDRRVRGPRELVASEKPAGGKA